MDEMLGPHFESALSELERHYNDGEQYVLHYVTAREAYNLAMAAATGATGDPSEYYDSEIKPYVAGPSALTLALRTPSRNLVEVRPALTSRSRAGRDR
jgi:hypothetical protein